MISASIVLYHTSFDLIEKVISSYAPGNKRRLFFIDNSEQQNDDVKGLISKDIEYVFVGKNIGYGSAHNIGIRRAIEIGSDYHIVLNPDLCFKPQIIDELVAYANLHKDVVYMLPKVIYPDGTLQYLCKLLPTPMDLIIRRFLPKTRLTDRWNDRYVLKSTGYDKIMNPPCLSGCFMFMRTKILKEYNLFFDERFFMYCEDFDLMRRLHRIGKTLYYPNVHIIHNHKKESYKNKKMFMQHVKSAFKYFNKYGWFIDYERQEVNSKILQEVSSYSEEIN